MAKDPAMLWYWSDWHSGTTTLSRFLKGCYMDLLHAQFNSGHLTLEEIKTVLGSDFGTAWPTIQKKFTVDEAGKYFNERLEEEQIKRANFTASRRKNLQSSHMDKHMRQHMEPHMENENRNENEIVIEERGGMGEKVPRATTNDTLGDVEQWTRDVMDDNDRHFASMIHNAGQQLDKTLVLNHLALCARYNWHERMTTQQAFRLSLLNYIKENAKNGSNGKKQVSIEDLNRYRNV